MFPHDLEAPARAGAFFSLIRLRAPPRVGHDFTPERWCSADEWRALIMKTRYTVVLSMMAGAALGGAAIQGVSAQLAAKKAYTVTELETLDAKAAADFATRVTAAQTSAGGRNLRTGGGKVVGLEGPPPPQRVAITEWDSLEKAEAFFKSKAWTDLGPERAKALKTIRRYAVEAAN